RFSDPACQLPAPLFGNAQALADLFERQALLIIEAGPHAENFSFAWIEQVQQTVDLARGLLGLRHLFLFVAAIVGSRFKEILVAGHEPFPVRLLVGNAASEILHDRPARVSAELVAASVVELLYGPDQRHVAVRD